MPELQERDYLVTQVIADYLSDHEDGPIDGILYPSAQAHGAGAAQGRNVVLFPRSAQVEGADKLFAAEVALWDLDMNGQGFYMELQPGIRLPPPPGPEASDVMEFSAVPTPPSLVPSLRINLQAMHVHEVQAVAVQTRAVPIDVLPPSVDGSPFSKLRV